MGRAMRASAQDKRTSALMGVNVNAVIALTFVIGSAMGAMAGGFYGAVYHFARPDMGFVPGLKAFIAAVLGGIGNIPGAFLGGLLLGLVESLGAAYLPMGSQYRDAFAFIILILLALLQAFRSPGLHYLGEGVDAGPQEHRRREPAERQRDAAAAAGEAQPYRGGA